MADRKSDQIAQDLLGRIVRGELAVGSLLPKEEELAAGYGVNRTAVREAVKRLEVHRLVRPVRRRGTEVLDPLASLSPDVLRAMLAPRPGEVSSERLRDLLELRALIDVEMAGLAAERRTDDDLAAIEAALDGMEARVGSPRAYAAAVDELGLAIARATHNLIFRMMLEWHRHVWQGLEDLLLLVRMPTGPMRMGSRMLVDLIRRGDGAAARALVGEHHRIVRERLMGTVGEMGGEAQAS